MQASTSVQDSLAIHSLHTRHPAVSEATGAFYALVTGVCLQRHHEPPTSVTVSSETHGTANYDVTWPVPSPSDVRGCAEINDAVCVGAYCLALAAVDSHMQLVGLRRAESGSGSDYYLVPAGAQISDDTQLDLERDDLIRLEVSGIDDDDHTKLQDRGTVKVRQARR
jgi:hypothetical protein